MISQNMNASGGAERYTITVSDSLNMSGLSTLQRSAAPGEFVGEGLYYVGSISSIVTDGGKNVPYEELGTLEKSFLFVMPADNVTIG